jgi:hypothetical protein
MRAGFTSTCVVALGLACACGENANEIGTEHDVPGVGGAAGGDGQSAVGGSLDGDAGALGSAGGPSGSGGASDGAGGAGLGGAPSESGGASTGTGGAVAGTGGSAGATAAECDDGTGWDLEWQQLECDALALINERRATGYDCGIGYIAPVGQAARHQLLSEIARDHAQYMKENDCLGPSLCPGREDYPAWVVAAGFTGTMEYEVAASGQLLDAEQLVDMLFVPDPTPRGTLPTVCDGMMDAEADKIAVGYYDHYWMVFLASGGD